MEYTRPRNRSAQQQNWFSLVGPQVGSYFTVFYSKLKNKMSVQKIKKASGVSSFTVVCVEGDTLEAES